MIRDEEYYMQIAFDQAEKAYKLNEIPVGCVIECNGEIVAKTHNLKETNQVATDHAEILAIQAASHTLKTWRLSECSLYVTLEPCAMCASAIVQSRIRKVVIGTLDSKEGAVISSKHIFENNHNHQLIVKTKVLEEKSKKIIEDFLKGKRKYNT